MNHNQHSNSRSETSGVRFGHAPVETFDEAEAADYRGRGPKGFQRSDERILEEVCERLSEHPHIDASDITVTCSAGLVTLEGSVDNRASKHRVEDLVSDSPGVKDVANRIKVKATGHPLYQEQQVSQGNRVD